ncbi:MAG: virulence RhuM family protein [Candidatus Aminicenantes bacterium]|nr:virulence RhuM family protein [Candidatus Aminicenantes bacterium]
MYKEEELNENSTTEVFSVVQKEGNREVSRNVTCYSLEAIIAVGYRVNSERGTQFRQWAITILQQYIHKGGYGTVRKKSLIIIAVQERPDSLG